MAIISDVLLREASRLIAMTARSVIGRLPPDVIRHWNDNPTEFKNAIKETLLSLKENFPIWKTVTVGNIGSVKRARKLLKKADIEVVDHGKEIFAKILFNAEETSIELVLVSPK